MIQKFKKKRKADDEDNGFGEWGGYMNAKITKLEAQFEEEKQSVDKKSEKTSEIFKGISIFVNGYTEPSADELRCIMLQHGGTYHHYYRTGKTTHMIANSLPNAKFNLMQQLKIVKSNWITESLKAGKLLDYKKFLLLNDFPNSFKKENNLLEYCKQGVKKETEVPKTAADEGYLTEFYNNSRLHYISTLGAMLKQHVIDLRENHNGEFPGRIRILQTKTLSSDASFHENYFVESNIIMHIDMDCFFVSVALRNYPHLKGKPVAVTHARGNTGSDNPGANRKFEFNYYKKKMQSKIKGNNNQSDESDEDLCEEFCNEKSSMSEIASCSYEARKFGVRKGMYLGGALKLCPDLKTVPYDFKGYKEVSLILYNTVAEYTLDIEGISCDELVIDCSNLLKEIKIPPETFAEILRKEIFSKTNCTSSVGIGANKLLAKLATKHAKPDGQFYLSQEKVYSFMVDLDVNELPGVGRTLSAKLKSLEIKTCGDLQNMSLGILKKEFGTKTGEMLYKNCRGEDDRKVNYSHERKSVSAEVNYGIRFNDNEETETFLKQLSEEVSKRLKDVKLKGKNITFKLMFRAKDAPVETAKFLGHGVCDQINRTASLPVATNESSVIAKSVISMYYSTSIPPNELRGIGIQITKLEPIKKNSKTLQNYFGTGQESKIKLKSEDKKQQITNKTSREEKTSVEKELNRLPPISSLNSDLQIQKPSTSKQETPSFIAAPEIDMEVLASLPKDIRLEVLKDYNRLDLAEKFDVKKLSQKPEYNNEQSQNTEKEVIETPPNCLDITNENLDEEAKDILNLSLSDIRTMIKEWVAAEQDPQVYDMKMLKSYLCILIKRKKLEDLSILMKCLCRHIKSRHEENEVWKATYNNIVESVQRSMISIYGKRYAAETID